MKNLTRMPRFSAAPRVRRLGDVIDGEVVPDGTQPDYTDYYTGTAAGDAKGDLELALWFGLPTLAGGAAGYYLSDSHPWAAASTGATIGFAAAFVAAVYGVGQAGG
jgi:hypothetical protein